MIKLLSVYFFGLLVVVSIRSYEVSMRNLTNVTWAHAVNNKTYLEAALATNITMLEADIVMGRMKGAESGPQLPVMAHPPATTSDLSLADFLAQVKSHNSGRERQKGVKLDFKSIEAFEQSQTLIEKYTKSQSGFPVWLNADILPGPVHASATPVDAARFLDLSARHPRAVLSIGWTTSLDGEKKEGEYNRDHIGSMLAIIRANNIKQAVTFPVRAALASNSQPVLLDLLRETAYLNSTLTVWSAPTDAVVVDRLRALILTVGLEKAYMDVPEELEARLRLPAEVKTWS